jgi:uncharacterized protein YcbX
MAPTVTHLFCYPLKGARGFPVDVMPVGRLGPKYDRRWMVVDESGMFVAQRSERRLGIGIREMCLVETRFTPDGLVLRAPDMPELRVPQEGTNRVPVQIWEQHTVGIEPDDGGVASDWITEYLSRFKAARYRLVRMPDDGTRPSKRGKAHLAYADAYPFLVVSQGSLDDLNRRIAERRRGAGEPSIAPLGWDRFRPNIVLDGCPPYFEDEVDRLTFGADLVLVGGAVCVRCPVPATDQRTAKLGKEPLKTLATYRRNPDPDGSGVVFGRNFDHRGTGEIRVGDVAHARA